MGRAAAVVLVVLAVATVAFLVPLWACGSGGGIHGPGDGSTVSGVTTIAVDAKSDGKIAGVDLYVDGTYLDSVTTSPYAYAWDTTAAKNGAHTLSGKIRAKGLADGQVKAVSVTVEN